MSSPEGTRFEAAVQAFLLGRGVEASRPRQYKQADVGDLWVDGDLVMQAKAWANMAAAVSKGVADVRVQAVQARRQFGAAVVKRPHRKVEEAIVVMTLGDFAALLKSRELPGL